MSHRAWRSWSDVFRYYLDVKGYDHAYAAFRAEEWERRKRAKARKIAKDSGPKIKFAFSF